MFMKRRRTIFILLAIIVVAALGVKIFKKPSGPKVKNLITDKDAISIYHRWTIYFENEFNLDDFDNIDIKVQDSQNNDVDVIIQTDNAMQRIFVSPPEEGYKEGEKYTITVTTDLSCSLYDNRKNVKSEVFYPKRAYKNDKVVIEDKNLEAVIRETIDKAEGDLYIEDVESIKALYANGREIKSLYGIEYLVNIRALYLDVNEIEDISPLASLIYLENLGLSNNKITDISALENLKLKYLSLSQNKIKDYEPIRRIYDSLHWKDFELE